MDIEEIHKTGFFRAFIDDYISFFDNRNEDYYRLVYTFCNSEEEKHLATLEEITIIKNRIKSLGDNDISAHFLRHYRRKTPIYGYEAKDDDAYWIDHFNDSIPDIITSFTPYSKFGLNFDELGEKEYPGYILNEIGSIERIEGRKLNLPFLIQCEEEIMEEIEKEIRYYKRNKYWEIDIIFFEMYINQNESVKRLFNFCELLAQLFMLRELESWLDIKENDDEVIEKLGIIDRSILDKFNEYGFYDLPMVKVISTENQDKLITLIFSNTLPYRIALFDYLGFLDHLEKEYFLKKCDMHKEIVKWFGTDLRNIRGLINALIPYSAEDKKRYTSHKHIEKVKIDYLSLK